MPLMFRCLRSFELLMHILTFTIILPQASQMLIGDPLSLRWHMPTYGWLINLPLAFVLGAAGGSYMLEQYKKWGNLWQRYSRFY